MPQRIMLGIMGWIALALFPALLQAIDGHATNVPFVQSFERFARHGEMAIESSGRLLVSELSCTACHTSALSDLQPKSGPKLEAVGRRVRDDWIADYLRDPSATKPGTTMPDLLGHLNSANKERVIAALVAFLSSQQAAFPELKATGLNPVPHEFWNKGRVEIGKQLVHQVGCVACHEPAADFEGGVKTTSSIDQLLEQLEPEEIAKLGLAHAMRSVASVPLPDLRRKYTTQGLTHFLLDPALVRPAGRMPSMKLGTVEAADIAAYLQSTSSPTTAPTEASIRNQSKPAQLREEGRRLFSELGCVHCHSASGTTPRAKSKPLRSLSLASDRSCLSKTRHANVPHFALDTLQKQAIQAAVQTDEQPGPRAKSTAQSILDLTLMQLNCLACHQRDARGGIARGRDRFFETVGQVDLGDEGRMPPSLTGVGRKLNTNWMKVVFQGNGDVRPHLQIRMPKYPLNEVQPMIEQLAAADAPSSGPAKSQEAVDAKLKEAGRQLFNLGCVQCHPVRGESLPSVVGVDVGNIGTRVRRLWFDDFLLNPASLKPRTRMPTFFAEGSVNKEILDGDVNLQIAALWHYLEDIARQPLPDKIEQVRQQNFELRPSDKPILLRTFMEQAGTHAIAVGFREQVHYAFDSESVRLAEAWNGRFLDAQGTWNDRFTPPAIPLSKARIRFPIGPEFAILNSPSSTWPVPAMNGPPHSTKAPSAVQFLGYRLEKSGAPAFQYQIGNFSIEDRIAPAAHNGTDSESSKPHLIRLLTIQPTKPTTASNSTSLWFRAAASGKPLRRNGASCTTDSGLTVTLPESIAAAASIRQTGSQSQWLVPISTATQVQLTLEYRW